MACANRGKIHLTVQRFLSAVKIQIHDAKVNLIHGCRNIIHLV